MSRFRRHGIMPWMKHLLACCNVTRQAFEIAKTIGDLTYAVYSRISLNHPAYRGGRSAR